MSSEYAAPARARPLALIADQDVAVRELLTEMFYDLGWEAESMPLPLWPEDVLRLRPQLLLLELRQANVAEALHFASALTRTFALANLHDRAHLHRPPPPRATHPLRGVARPPDSHETLQLR